MPGYSEERRRVERRQKNDGPPLGGERRKADRRGRRIEHADDLMNRLTTPDPSKKG